MLSVRNPGFQVRHLPTDLSLSRSFSRVFHNCAQSVRLSPLSLADLLSCSFFAHRVFQGVSVGCKPGSNIDCSP